jgi:glycosyltransferase involved in cell wall biosynthesis
MNITVIFSTFNRSAYLSKTLEAMTELDSVGINVQFAVVDNNSTDETSQVIDSFADRLPLVHLFEPRPGKNCALNHALDSVEMGDIVVFTDDDIVPHYGLPSRKP